MGQKVNPNGIRLGITKPFNSTWYANSADFPANLYGDYKVREFLTKKLKKLSVPVSRIVIDRPAKSIKVTLFSSRPGTIYGKGGADIQELIKEISKIAGVPAQVLVEEIRKPDIEAKLVANNIVDQLEHRVMFRRAMKKAIQAAMKNGAKGIKIEASGRLGGAEIARSEWLREGRVPLHTLRADIDYALSEAKTTYGIIGVKVWIFKGEVLGGLPLQTESHDREPNNNNRKPRRQRQSQQASQPQADKADKANK